MTDLPEVKLKALVNFPASAEGRTGIDVTKDGGTFYLDLDYADFQITPTVPAEDMPNSYNLIWDEVKQTFAKVPFALQATSGVASIDGHTGALEIGDGLAFTGETLEVEIGDGLKFTGGVLEFDLADQIASESESEAGTINTKLMTPLGTAQSVQTFLPRILAWKNGVLGDGTDQTVALQAIVDTIPVGVSVIVLKGTVDITSLDLTGKSFIHFVGQGYGDTTLRCSGVGPGAGLSVIDCYGGSFITFERLLIQANNASFDGILVNCGAAAPVSDTAHIHFRDCQISVDGTASTAIGVWMYGCTLSSFERCRFFAQGGPGVQLQNVAATLHANNITFLKCAFQAYPGVYPVEGSGDNIQFISCNFQNASDGKSYAYRSDIAATVRQVSFDKCTFYSDITPTGGSVWIKVYIGSGVSVKRCWISGKITSDVAIELGGGTSTGDPGTSGVRGFEVAVNTFSIAVCVNFLGTASGTLTGARGGEVYGNDCAHLNELFTNIANCRDMRFGFNTSYSPGSLASQIGFTPGFHGLPTSSVGLGVGSQYSDSGTIKIVT